MEWGGGMECEKPQRSLFYFAFFFPCSWLIQQIGGKYWAIYLTTLPQFPY
jgi:hypothetical protein